MKKFEIDEATAELLERAVGGFEVRRTASTSTNDRRTYFKNRRAEAMKKVIVTEETQNEAWNVITEVRDRSPRDPKDADTWDIVEALTEAGLLRED